MIAATAETTLAEGARRRGDVNALQAVNIMTERQGVDRAAAQKAVRVAYKGDSSLPLLDGITAADLATMDLPEPKWIVPGILPEGLAILAGKPKLGKSWLALGLGIATATGGEAFGEIGVEPGDVLYLALEDSMRRLKGRLASVLGGAPAPRNLHLFTNWPRLDQGGEDRLRAWLDATPSARLAMIDTVAKVRPQGKRNGNAYQEDYQALGGIHTIAAERGITLLIVHHLRKATADDVLDTVSGTTGLTGSADSVLVLSRERTPGHVQADATLFVSGRDVEEQEMALRFDKGTCSWLLLGDAAACRRSQQRQDILELLEGDTLGMTPKEIADALGKPGGTIRPMLRRMADDGELIASEGGRYAPL